MNLNGLNRLKRRHVAFRNGADIPRRLLVNLAKALGRKPSPAGKEPMYVSEFFPIRPLAIPSHQMVKEYTAKSILNQLEEDISHWEEYLKEEAKKSKGDKEPKS